ncbi:MAG: hypothetical protein ACF8QF_06505 [Phycisphaerales bacterium]
MPRRSGPTLLELATRSPRTPSRPAPREEPRERKPFFRRERPDPAPEPEIAEGPAIPRVVRLPVGYLFLAGALVVVLIVGGYLIGYRRADSAVRDSERTRAQRELESAVQDPLLDQAPLNPDLLPSAGRSGTPAAATNQPRQQAPAAEPAPASTEPGADPRTPGLNYFIVARDLPDEAERAAAYLRESGVPAAVVPSSTGSLRLVVALQGFTGDQMRAGEHNTLKARIQSLGRIWKRDMGGTTDWADTYPAKYSG